MDKFIKELIATRDDDLMVCHSQGIAYQADFSMAANIPGYFGYCMEKYANRAFAARINQFRCQFVRQHFDGRTVLDIGIGSGDFINEWGHAFGMDIDQQAIAWLKQREIYSDKVEDFEAITFWDVLEHLPEPATYLDRMPSSTWLFTSIPIFPDITKVRQSKHYRPNEHLYYFSAESFRWWMDCHGFDCISVSNEEASIGRDGILTFAFWKR